MRVIGVDPGKTTGICSFFLDEKGPSLIDPYEMDYLGVGKYFESSLRSYDTVVVCEAFIITSQTAKNTQAPWSLEVIGIVRYMCETQHVPFFLQAPSSAKRLVTDGVLQRAGVYFKGKGHACDAARHAMFYVLTELKQMQHALKEGA